MRFFTVALIFGICACATESDSVDVNAQALQQLAGRRASPCDNVHCVGTQHCIEVDGRARCVLRRYEKDAGTGLDECRDDADCSLQANYCGGCNCDVVLTKSFVAPVRECDLVACLVDPCRELVAICKEAKCVAAPQAIER